jgi:DNA helicase IV
MRDIVATIQSDQYRLITASRSGRSSSRAGRAPARPRSACTARRGSSTRTASGCARVLVVGPNPTFMEYVSHVLPTLGEESVEQRAVGELVDGSRRRATTRRTSRG